MSPPQKEKKSSSLPCEVFFACTRCGSRSRTVPQLLTHYKTAHKEEIANGTISNKEETISAEGQKIESRTKDAAEDKKGASSKKGSKEKKDDNESDVVYVEGSKKPAKPSGPVITHPEKDCVITRKRNVPLGMLEGKKNSLMVIFQHSDQNKPLPEGSSFKLRNTGGEQTYLVVANVDVDIIEQGKPPQGKPALGRPAKKAKTGK
ncbi:uncharacterized protein LOC129263653 [Lytechinus pictus]|uniref:uncharacterized protein LOC129263653 n=1 Tax=Lytechinus pictus TaxID=7653 RepID=UPI0030B9FD85